MNSSLLRIESEEQFLPNNLLDSNFMSYNEYPIFPNSNKDDDSSFFLPFGKNEDNTIFKNNLFSFENNSEFSNTKNNNNFTPFLDNKISEKIEKNENFDECHTMNNLTENASNINLNPVSLLTTSNSNSINNIGVKNDEIIFESKKDLNPNEVESDNLKDKVFKCDFLENISLGLDENEDDYYYNCKKDKIDLKNPKSLLAAIINLMKEKGPVDIKTIVSCLESKKDTFRKANGSKYKQDFNKLIRTTLNTPDIFYKTEEGNKYFFIEDKSAYYLKKKRERAMEKIFMNLKKKNNNILPINLKIQIDKVNLIIKKMEKKYKGDKKYVDVMICINLFKNLIKKYLYLVKMEKNNSLYELTILNEKVINICHTLEKLEKGELYFKLDESIVVNKTNEYNNQNHKNIMFVDGENNYFNEPPNII